MSENQAGTWEIKTVQTKDLLLFYPDDSDYFHDGMYAPFWSVYNNKVWEGYYQAGSASNEAMYHVTFNSTAISDYIRFLKAAPADMFISDFNDDNDNSCISQNWDQVTWDSFQWAP